MNYREPCYELPFVGAADVNVASAETRDGRHYALLSDSPFYPEGGGQPCDLGSLDGVRVLAARERDGTVEVELAGPVGTGSKRAEIDVDRRRDHAEQHTGQHLLSSVVARLFGCATVGFHLGAEVSTIDLDMAYFSEEDAEAAEDECERLIVEDYSILIHLCDKESARSFPLRKEAIDADTVRIVEIDGIDYSPCCGTHLPSTARVGALKITGIERIKGKTRIAFLAGGRAFRDYRLKAKACAAARAALCCSETELGERARSVAAEVAALKKTAAELSEARAGLEATEAARSCVPVSRVFRDRGADEAFAFVKACLYAGSPCAAASLPDLKLGAAFLDESAFAEFKAACEREGGKGGGRASFYQAKFPDAASLQRAMTKF